MHKIRSYFLSLWNLIDPLYYVFTRLSYIDQHNRKNQIFRVRLTRYKGRSVILSDGTSIHKNDFLLKIHLHNVKILKDLYQLDNDFRKGLYLYNSIKNSLPGLARFIHNHKDEKRIKAIIGVTMLHQGSERLGFEIHSIQNKAYLRFKQIAQFPIYFLSTVNQHRKNKPIPKYLFMPKQDLIEKYYPMPFPETDHFKRSEAPPMR